VGIAHDFVYHGNEMSANGVCWN